MASSYNEPDNLNPLSFLLGQALPSFVDSKIMVCLPGRIMAFDPATQLAQIQPGIRAVINGEAQDMAPIQNVPVCFPGNEQWYMYHEITPGKTEGKIHFSQRAIDTWVNSGGVTTPVDFRSFDQSDAFFDPGVRSTPGAIPNLPTSGVGMSNYSGDTKVALSSGEVRLEAAGSTMVLNASGFDVQAPSFTHNGKNVGDDHKHSDVESGNSNTGGPV